MKIVKKIPSERTEQTAVVAWWTRYALSSSGTYEPEDLFHIPNEGKRGDVQGYLMKMQGVVAGVPDLCLAIPAGKYHGLWIEMKSLKGKATSKQLDFLARLKGRGYAVAICHGFEEAVKTIKDYLALQYEDWCIFDE